MLFRSVPALTFAEKYILAATTNDKKINATILKSLHWAVLDCAEGTQEERAALSEKIEQLSPAARMKLIEGLKYE